MISIATEDPRSDPVVVAYLTELDAFNAKLYPPEANHHLSLDSLVAPDIHFYVARDAAGAVTATGALRICKATATEPAYGELKRIFVPETERGNGIGRKMIQHIEAAARGAGLHVLRLETGVDSCAALRAYERAGYHRRGPFGDYPDHPLSVFMEKTLDP